MAVLRLLYHQVVRKRQLSLFIPVSLRIRRNVEDFG